jgi:aspartate 1-decarboxylase
MKRTLLKSKIHRARVTESDLHYQGSVTIDGALMEAADIVEYEQVDVYDITNGARLTTYAISGPRGSGTICINGAAAHLVKPGDLVIIASYAHYDQEHVVGHEPRICRVDAGNRLVAKELDGTTPRDALAEG